MVAVNSDASVRNLKGPGRPVLDEMARARLVAALRAVDYVVIFNEPTVDAVAGRVASRRPRQGNRLLSRHRSRTRDSRRNWAFASPSSATPRITPRARYSNRFARFLMPERRFLVVRLGSLGDIVHTFPAVAALRETFASSEIVWLTHPAGSCSWPAAACLQKSGPWRRANFLR